jgi:transposase InsO family protein
MEQHPIEDRARRMASTVDSRHIGKADSRSVPRLLIGSLVEAGREIGQRPAPWKVSPRENGYIESFNGKMRDELLNGELLDTLDEAKVLVEAWRKTSNLIRPHNSLGYSPPVPEAHVIGKFTLGRAQC